MMNAVLNSPKIDSVNSSVAPIENGSVIDHIPAGKAFFILRLLKLENHKACVSTGMNLSSEKMRSKDMIKVEGWELSQAEATQIAIFAPRATVNIIQNSTVIHKYVVNTPTAISHCIICPNPNCITNHEKTSHLFHIDSDRKKVQLQCHFCEKIFSKHEITHYFP